MGALIVVASERTASLQSKGFIMIKRTIAIALVSVGLLAVSACNTVEGAGKDVSSAGKAVSNAAN